MGRVYMLDGFDGSGKTTIAKELAATTGIKYSHLFADYGVNYDMEPLTITEDEVVEMTRRALDKALFEDEDMIMDRGLITSISVLPEERWGELSQYFQKMQVVLCYATLEDTVLRLKSREWDENAWHHSDERDESKWYNNEYWININLKIAEKFNVPILNTSTGDNIENSVKSAMELFGLNKNSAN